MAAHRGHLGPQDTAHRVLDATDFCSPTHTNQPIATNSHLFSTHRYELTAASCIAAQQLSGCRRGVPVIGDDEAARQKTTVPVNIEHQIAVDRNAVVANADVIADDSSRQLQSRGSMGRRGRGAKSNSASRSLSSTTCISDSRVCSSIIDAILIALPSTVESNWKSIAHTIPSHASFGGS